MHKVHFSHFPIVNGFQFGVFFFVFHGSVNIPNAPLADIAWSWVIDWPVEWATRGAYVSVPATT